MYTINNTHLVSETDGLKLSVMEVLPKEPPRAVMQIVHGMCENKERYLPFMQYLAAQGIASVVFDQRGHGQSVKSREDLGYMYRAGVTGYLNDLLTVNQKIHEKFPGIPFILFGHSMGSLAVRAFASDHDDCMDMLIISGSPSDTGAKALGAMIAQLEGRVRGFDHRSKFLERLSFGSYVKKFADEESSFAWLSSDPETVSAYEASEYCGFTFTDDAYLVLFGLMKKAYDVKHWHMTKPDLPVLFLSGQDDPCMGSTKKFASAVQAMRNAGYHNVRGKIYEGMRHEILNEKDRMTVYKDIVKFTGRINKEDLK